MSKSKNLIGKVRVMKSEVMPWHEFTLRRGHLFGETEDGIYFVSGLEKGKGNRYKVYLCDRLHDGEQEHLEWKAYWLPDSNSLVKKIAEAVSEREALGIYGVDFGEYSAEFLNSNLTSKQPTPFKTNFRNKSHNAKEIKITCRVVRYVPSEA